MQMVALSTTNIRWSESYCFYQLLILILIFGMSTFSVIRAAHLSGTVSIYFLGTSTLILKQFKQKAFLWMYNRSVQFIFQLSPNLLDECEVQTLRGPAHHFQSIQQSLPSQVVPEIVCFIGIAMANSKKKNWNLLNMLTVLIILATTV